LYQQGDISQLLLSHGSGENVAFLGENIPILSQGRQPLFGCKI
jgi:hypothetical protein